MFSSRVHAAPSCSGIKARRRRKTSKEERVCAVCGQAFKKAEHLARHLRSHTKEKPFSCTVCSKAFARQDTLLRHSRSHATGREDGETHAVSLEPESHGCLDPELMSQISIATGVPTIPIHPEMTMPDDMISPPSSASIDKRTPDFSISEHSYHSQMTPLASFFSLEATDSWRNQECPPPPLWDSRLDQEWETLLTGDDFDLNAVNMSLLSASSQYIPAAEFPFDLNTTTSQPLPVDQQAKPHSNTVQRKWHTFCEMSSSGQMTPDVPNEENYIDETYRKRLADRLQQPVQTGILPSTPFLDLCIQAYFSKFHPLFPVVHMASFRPGTQNSILLLSICSVGSLFVGSSRAVSHGISMFERLNKAILASWDTYTFKSGGSSFIALQASIIGQSFGLLLGRPKDLIGIDIFHGSIIAWARKAKLFNLQPAEYHLLDTEGPSLEEVWMNWVQSEVKQRIILGLHIHDALLSRIHHHEPLLHNSLDRLPQISSNELFTASNASTWKSLMLETQANPGPLTHPSPTQRIQHQSRTPSDFALNGLLESINALTYEDQEHHSPTPDWIHTVQKSHKLLTNFHIKYNPHPNKPSGYSHPNPSYTHTWPCTMILWHSIFITLHTDINALENSLGREGHNPNTPTYAKSWIRTQDAKRALLHAMLLQRQFETLPAGAEPAIHVPLSLYYCGIIWACFLCFGRLDQGLDLDQGVTVTLSAGDARHFDELGLEGVDGVVFLEQLGSSILPGRLAMGSLLRVVDLLQRVNHFRIARRLAETLLAVVEETQGLF